MSYLDHKATILHAFECQSSGHCCKAPGFVYVTTQDISNMAHTLGMSVQSFRSFFVRKHNGWDVVASPYFQSDCFLNNQNKCKVYEARPTACQTYPDWPSIWESEKTLLAESELCPGLKKAIKDVKNTGLI
jgi:Fe-S-cluster containining protein